ncbi:MAG: hypothetical protein IJR68_04955 [Fretibacterium sp.]|nr:hypothetical protein [Fretibacterium sp.]
MIRRTCCPLVILVVLSILLNLSPAWGLNSYEYAGIMNGVLGPADRNAEGRLKYLWDGMLRLFDSPGMLKEIKERFPWVSENIYERKLLLRWMWGSGPAKHAPLMKQAEEDIRQYAVFQNVPAQERDAFLKEQRRDLTEHLIKQEARQRGELTSLVVRVLNIPTRHDYAKTTAAILYDLHLLAEYTATPTAQMARIEEIEKSLGSNLKKLLTQGDNAEKRRRGDEIERALRDARRVNGNNKDKAQAMMKVAGLYFPAMLKENFEKEMRLKGIVLR